MLVVLLLPLLRVVLVGLKNNELFVCKPSLLELDKSLDSVRHRWWFLLPFMRVNILLEGRWGASLSTNSRSTWNPFWHAWYDAFWSAGLRWSNGCSYPKHTIDPARLWLAGISSYLAKYVGSLVIIRLKWFRLHWRNVQSKWKTYLIWKGTQVYSSAQEVRESRVYALFAICARHVILKPLDSTSK